MKNFRKLTVWTKSHELTLAVYRATAAFPKAEVFGLTAQMRRSAASIPSNIAEGCGRDGDGDLGRFLQIASGSAAELEYQLILARNLGYIEADEYQRLAALLDEVSRMLTSFRQRVQVSSPGARNQSLKRAAGQSS
jgi:four helix bundle protein